MLPINWQRRAKVYSERNEAPAPRKRLEDSCSHINWQRVAGLPHKKIDVQPAAPLKPSMYVYMLENLFCPKRLMH